MAASIRGNALTKNDQKCAPKWVMNQVRSVLADVREAAGAGRRLSLEQDTSKGLLLQWQDAEGHDVIFIQPPGGGVGLVVFRSGTCETKNAASFSELLSKNAGLVEASLIAPLTRLGLVFPLDPSAPAVVAAATSGFGAPAPVLATKVDEALKRLASDEQDEREAGTVALTELYVCRACSAVVGESPAQPDGGEG